MMKYDWRIIESEIPWAVVEEVEAELKIAAFYPLERGDRTFADHAAEFCSKLNSLDLGREVEHPTWPDAG